MEKASHDKLVELLPHRWKLHQAQSMSNGQNTTNKNNNKTIATITHDGAFVAIVVQIGITTCSLPNAYVIKAKHDQEDFS